jgi:glyoxylase-like metal-dependent hydrolase (beta-lactamase superfamily II)
VRFCDELDFAFGWIQDDERIERAAHALVDDGFVWLVDALDWPAAIVRAQEHGEIRGIVQLLDRHERDCGTLAERLHVPLHRVPRAPIVGSPFVFLNVIKTSAWNEVALWWPARRTLVTADALGTVSYFRGRDERVGVHPFLRLWPSRALRRAFPEHILCGHGDGVHEHAAESLHTALRTARRRLPAALINGFRRA